MREGWRKVRLGEVADLNGGYAFKSTQYTSEGRFVLRTVNIRDNFSITRDGATFISEQEAAEYSRFSLHDRDTLFVMVAATLGKVGYVRSDVLPALLNQNMWVIRAKPGLIEPDFLQFCFRELSKIPLAWVSGSARSFLRRDDVRNLEFSLPPLPEQREIAATLGALDDKIELNRKMNATLEAMARALFRDWFVDFGPTRAKMEDCEPYLSPDLWSLFPDRLDDEGRPEAWETRRVDQLLELAYGKALKATDRQPGDIRVYGSGGITGTHSEALVSNPSIIVGRKGTVGSLYWEDDPFWPIDTVFYVRPFVPLTFCYYMLEQMGLDNMNTDAAVPGLNRNNVYRLETAWPGETLVRAFDEFSSDIRARLRHNNNESRTLAETRDLLLPRLMSGELRAAEAERLASKVA